jgi:hypothetical protein
MVHPVARVVAGILGAQAGTRIKQSDGKNGTNQGAEVAA